MSNPSCTLWPQANGKDSKLYRAMLKSIQNRPLTNMLYASYLVSNAPAAMDAAGYERDALGEHKAADYLAYINFASIQRELSNLGAAEIALGAKDTNGQRIDYTNAREALEKADDFNDGNHPSNSSQGMVANVYKHGDVFHIIVSEKNSRTLTQVPEVKEKLQVWNLYRQVFNSIGIDIENLPPELNSVFSAHNINIARDLKGIKNTPLQYISKQNAVLLFTLYENTAPVQRVIQSLGSIDAAAQAIDDINHGNVTVSRAQMTLLGRAIASAQQFQGLDLDALQTQTAQISTQVKQNSPEEAIKAELHKLNKKYKIDIEEIHRKSKEITNWSDAAADAVMQLERRIRELKRAKGDTTEGKRLQLIEDQLLRELANKRYYSGMMNFLTEASTQLGEIDNMLLSIPQTGTELEKAMGKAKILQGVFDLINQYKNIIDAMASENTKIPESISQVDIDRVRTSARSLKDYIDKKLASLQGTQGPVEATMTAIMSEFMGNTAPDGQTIINVVQMAQADSSVMDFLYSMGRASNPIIAAMGKIVRDAELGRDEVLNRFALDIRRATDVLYKSGNDSKFIYHDDGHIISDIDWQEYKKARKWEMKALRQQGLHDWDFIQALRDWEDNNTEERVVDTSTGRTERVPNGNYRLNNGMVWNSTTNKMEFTSASTLTDAQKEYYNTMMQIKGEIGSYLPAYAQKQYLPPQLRRSMLDALGAAKNSKDVLKAFKNKLQNIYKVREDDTEFAEKGIIDGEEYLMTESSYDNAKLRQIPIFFVNKVEQDELLKDFSAGVQALAATAVNYDAMNSIAQVVEFMGDFVKSKAPRNNKPESDEVGNKFFRVFTDLVKRGRNTNTEGLIEGFIAQHIYGQKLDPEQFGYQWAKLVQNIIGYTSFKGLATNVKGAFSNYLVGEFQMMIEAGAGEFYGFSDFLWAHKKLIGGAGVGGEIMELLTNNMNHKATLMRELFDPINENYLDKSHARYYKSMFRQLVSHDCSFIGYASGEYLIHYVNMYAVLHRQKVKLNGRLIPLFDAFEVSNKKDGNSELTLKQGVTLEDGVTPVTQEWLQKIRNRIRYVNQTTHGSMNEADKGLIHQKLWGRAVMNFRQWMVEHYSRRFRKAHYDDSLGEVREGYWVSLYNYLLNEDTKETWKDGQKRDAMLMFMKDFWRFTIRAQSQWSNLSEMQKANVKRVHTEMVMFIALSCLASVLGEPEEHKKEFWRRWWIYQVKRLLLDTEASMPHPKALSSMLTILQSPMAGLNTVNSWLYTIAYGPFNGDLIGPNNKIKSGPHKGENRYWRNFKKYALPFYKDWEQMQKFDNDESLFQVFKDTPSKI